MARGNFSIWISTGCIRGPKRLNWLFTHEICIIQIKKITYNVTFLSFALSFFQSMYFWGMHVLKKAASCEKQQELPTNMRLLRVLNLSACCWNGLTVTVKSLASLLWAFQINAKQQTVTVSKYSLIPTHSQYCAAFLRAILAFSENSPGSVPLQQMLLPLAW